MPDLLVPLLLVLIWVSLGLVATAYLGRSGRRRGRTGRTLVTSGPETAGERLTALVAIDGSLESERALADAARMLTGPDVQFVLLVVLDPDLGDRDPDAARLSEQDLREHAATLTLGTVEPAFEIASGEPVRVILERAGRDDIDVVVVGRRGRGLSQRIMGSVADQVVRRSPRPVLLGSA